MGRLLHFLCARKNKENSLNHKTIVTSYFWSMTSTPTPPPTMADLLVTSNQLRDLLTSVGKTRRGVTKKKPASRSELAVRHRIVFRVATEVLQTAPDFKMARARMMEVVADKRAIMDLYPTKVGRRKGDGTVYHAVRNVFQSSRHDVLPGETYYTPHGLVKMQKDDPAVSNVIWTYASVPGGKFTAQYIP